MRPSPATARTRLIEALFSAAAILGTTVLLQRGYGKRAAVRGGIGASLAFSAQHLALGWLLRRTQTTDPTPADWLTYSRAMCASIVAGLVASGMRDRRGPAGRLGWMAIAWGVSVDTFDGALAKRMGPTRAGPTLDIESDSWLTLWAAVAAVCWGRLPGWTVLASVVRYAHPLIALRRKELPVGGGPWWGRLTGGSQTALQLVALAPFLGTWRDWLTRRACLPISGGQLLAMLLLFRTHGRP